MNLIYSLSKMSLTQILALGLFLSGIYWFTDYDNGDQLREKIDNVKVQIKQTDLKIKKVKTELENIKRLKKSVEVEGSKSIQLILEYIPNSLTTATISSYINKEAKESGIDIINRADRGVLDFENFYEILKVRIKCSGSFPQIVYFLSKLTQQKIILTSDNITMNTVQGERSVVVDADIYGYRYKEPDKEVEFSKDKDKEKNN